MLAPSCCAQRTSLCPSIKVDLAHRARCSPTSVRAIRREVHDAAVLDTGDGSRDGGAACPAPAQREATARSTATGTIAGAAALITGSTVGAGILALPESTQAAGLGPSIVILAGIWAALSGTALLLAEVNLACHRTLIAAEGHAAANRVIPLAEMASMTVGPAGKWVTGATYAALSFTLVLAYAAKAGSIIDGNFLHPLLHTDVPLGSVLFSGAIGSVLLFGGTRGAERVNSACTAALLVLFTAIVGAGGASADWAPALEHADWTHATGCLPIVYMSLVYHDLIPTVVHYLGFDRKRAVRALLLGSLVPLGMFLSWEAVCAAAVPYTGAPSDPLQTIISQHGPVVALTISAFSIAAVATSAIGTGLSLTAFLETTLGSLLPAPSAAPSAREQRALGTGPLPALPAPVEGGDSLQAPADDAAALSAVAAAGQQQPVTARRAAAVALAFGPATYLSLDNPDAFMTASHYAGAYGMTVLYGLLPPVMAWCAREDQSYRLRLLRGGQFALSSLIAVGMTMEALQIATDLQTGSAADGAAVVPLLPQPLYELASTDLAGSAGTLLHTVLMALPR